jgi:hypothetical protein
MNDLVTLVRQLACAERILHDTYDEHLINNGEILPSLLIEEYAMRFVSLYVSSLAADTPEANKETVSVQNIANSVEAILSSDNSEWSRYMKTLFLENLWHAENLYRPLKQMLGPLAHQALDEWEQTWQRPEP